jgi:predicted nucleic acid-binding protein
LTKKVPSYMLNWVKVEAFDLLIASIAIERGATLLTTDMDFEKIEELKKEIIAV